jgi:hypothetical protein
LSVLFVFVENPKKTTAAAGSELFPVTVGHVV